MTRKRTSRTAAVAAPVDDGADLLPERGPYDIFVTIYTDRETPRGYRIDMQEAAGISAVMANDAISCFTIKHSLGWVSLNKAFVSSIDYTQIQGNA